MFGLENEYRLTDLDQLILLLVFSIGPKLGPFIFDPYMCRLMPATVWGVERHLWGQIHQTSQLFGQKIGQISKRFTNKTNILNFMIITTNMRCILTKKFIAFVNVKLWDLWEHHQNQITWRHCVPSRFFYSQDERELHKLLHGKYWSKLCTCFHKKSSFLSRKH